jgi:hypothetical protein
MLSVSCALFCQVDESKDVAGALLLRSIRSGVDVNGRDLPGRSGVTSEDVRFQFTG